MRRTRALETKRRTAARCHHAVSSRILRDMRGDSILLKMCVSLTTDERGVCYGGPGKLNGFDFKVPSNRSQTFALYKHEHSEQLQERTRNPLRYFLLYIMHLPNKGWCLKAAPPAAVKQTKYAAPPSALHVHSTHLVPSER